MTLDMLALSYLSVSLCCKADNRAQQAAGQHNLEIITVTVESGDCEAQRHANRESDRDAEPQVIELLREEPRSDSRDQTLDCGTEHDASQLVAHFRREPGSEAVEYSE